MTEIKPCPWCGCQPIIHLGKKTGCQLHGEPMQGIVIECNFHGCPVRPRLQAGDIYNGGQDKAKQEATVLWNTRTANPPSDEQKNCESGLNSSGSHLNVPQMAVNLKVSVDEIKSLILNNVKLIHEDTLTQLAKAIADYINGGN